MGDSFVDSMYRGFQMSHMLESQKRERQEAQRQEMVRQFEMAKLAQGLMQERARREFLANPPEEFKDSVNSRMPGAMDAIRSGAMGIGNLPKEPAEAPVNSLEALIARDFAAGRQPNPAVIAMYEKIKAKDDSTAKIKEFETITGMDPTTRGTPGYRQKFLDYLRQNKQAVHITTPRQGPDPEDQELKREQKRNLIAERKLKMKYGALPTLNSLTGETVYPTNPQTRKPFTQDEWAVVQQRAYEDVAGAAKPGSGGKGKQAEGLAGVPPAAKHRGRTIRDTKTGRRYKSNGSAWVEVK
jgi:hypothetical protein